MNTNNNPLSSRALNRAVLVGGLLLIGLMAVVLYWNPFGWEWGRTQTADFAAIEAVPATSPAYLHVDLMATDRERLAEIYDAFVRATAATNSPLNQANQAFTQLQQELELTFAADVLPWAGQHLGLALLDVAATEWIIVVESQNREMADAFLSKLGAGWQQRTGITAVPTSYQRVNLTSFESTAAGERLAFGRSANLVLIGSSLAAVQQAVEAQKGDSLASAPVYNETVSAAAPEYPITLYIDGVLAGELIGKIREEVAVMLPFDPLLFTNTAGIKAVSLSLVTTVTGLQIEGTTIYDGEQMSATQQAAFDKWLAQPQTAVIAPEDTLIYLAGSGLNLAWPLYRESLTTSDGNQADFDEAMRLFANQFGLNPGTDLFPYLDGETAVAIVPSRSGPLAQVLRLNIGGALLAGTTEQASLAANLAAFSSAIAEPQLGLATVNDASTNALTLYEIETVLQPGFPLLYGTGHNYFLLGTSNETLNALNFSDGRSLADNPDFQAIQTSLPNNQTPTFYADVQGLLAVLNSSPFMLARAREFAATTAVVQPIHTIAATNTVGQNSVQTTIIVIMATEE